MSVSVVVLVGGKSSRLGRDKIFETLGSQTLLERVVATLSPLGSEIIVVTSSPGCPIPPLPQGKVREVSDIYPGKGSLGGVYTGISVVQSHHSLVVGGDMPFLQLPLLRYMVELCQDYDVVVPRVGGFLEPLHALYSKECLASIELMFQQGRLSIPDFYPLVRVRYVEEAEVKRFDPEYLSFFNINTEEDLVRARALLAARQGVEENA